jgi:hypothetical protein
MILDDPFFDAQWLRAAGHSGAGGAEIGECLAVADAVRGSDVNDEIGATARKLFDTLSCRKEFMTFTAAEGAGAHCESGAREVFNQRALDWLDRVLGESDRDHRRRQRSGP